MEIKMRTRLFSLFLNLVMFVTFNLSAFPSGFADEINATTEADCEQVDQNAKNGKYIYKPGCEFEEARTEINEWTPDTYGRIMSALFAIVAVTYIKYNYLSSSSGDCSENKAANITIRAVQASSLAYLAGEIQANMRFKKAQKDAIKISFANEKTESTSETNKQVEAFNALISLYEKLRGALNTKNVLTSVAEAGFLAAEGVELANIIKCNAKCSEEYAALISKISTYAGTLSTETGASVAACVAEKNVAAAACSAACSSVATLVGKLNAKVQMDIQRSRIMANMDFLKLQITEKKNFSLLSNVFNPSLKEPPKLDLKLNTPRKYGAQKESTMWSTYYATYKAEQAQIRIAANTCSTSTGQTIGKSIQQLVSELTRKGNVNCCGTDGNGLGGQDVANLLTGISPKSRFASKADIEFKPLAKEIFGKGAYIERKEVRELLKIVIYNSIFEQEILNGQKITNKKLIKKLAGIDKKIDRAIEFLDENASDLYNEKSDVLAESLFDGNSFQKTLQKLVTETTELIIPKAKAEFNDFLPILGIAGSVLLLGNTFEKLYTKWAGVSPKSRAIYWGLMAGVNGVTLGMDIKRNKDIKKRIEAIKLEKKKFIDASAGTAITSGDNESDTGLSLNQTEYKAGERGYGNYPGCMAPTGDSYGPVKCPSIIKKDAIRVPQLSDRTKGLLTGTYGSTLGSLSDIAYGAANGSYIDNPNLLGGKLESATGNSKAMRAHNAKLRQKLDEMENSGAKVKDKNGREIKPLSLAAIHDQMMNSLGRGATGSLGGAELASDSSEDENKEEETENKVADVKAVETQVGTPANADFSLDLGLDDDSFQVDETASLPNSEEHELKDYVLEQNDINKKTEVSIFKILSNRYLLSYPKVLEEKK